MEKLKAFFGKSKDYVVIFILGVVFIAAAIDLSMRIQFNRGNGETYSPSKVQECVMRLKYDAAKCALVNEIDAYIKGVAPFSSLDGYVVAEECLKNSVDVCFVLAQGEQESHFGTTGLARKTNSVFNVFAFDGLTHNEISSKGKYAHPNYSVPAYISLLKSDYLVGDKTEYELMENGGYVNKNGARYASSETYEKSLYDKFAKIKTTTKIDSLCQEVNKYKLFLGL